MLHIVPELEKSQEGPLPPSDDVFHLLVVLLFSLALSLDGVSNPTTADATSESLSSSLLLFLLALLHILALETPLAHVGSPLVLVGNRAQSLTQVRLGLVRLVTQGFDGPVGVALVAVEEEVEQLVLGQTGELLLLSRRGCWLWILDLNGR
jgi:hypothetical protein